MHFVRKSNLQPFLIGAADAGLLKAVGELGLPAAGIDPDLDVWSYKRKPRENKEVYEMKSEWKYATISSRAAAQQGSSSAARQPQHIRHHCHHHHSHAFSLPL